MRVAGALNIPIDEVRHVVGRTFATERRATIGGTGKTKWAAT